jgi:hypothetical protein
MGYGILALLPALMIALFCGGNALAEERKAADDQAIREVVRQLFEVMQTDDADKVQDLLDRALADARREADEQAIRAVVEQYFQALKDRDAEGMRNILSSPLIAVEAGDLNSHIEVIDTRNTKTLFPPEGNDDWENVTISEMNVTISESVPSVAMVSFVLMMKLGDEEIKRMEETVASEDPPPPPFSITKEEWKQARKRVERAIKDGGHRVELLALVVREGSNARVARKDGRWKIVVITLPH